MSIRSMNRMFVVSAMALVAGLAISACGSDPTATPTPRPTPTPVPVSSGSSSAQPTATPTAVPVFDPASIWEEKTIRIVVGFSPGGGYDQISRIFTRVARNHFPGNPRFVVSNLPGGGGLRALQTTVNSEPDGLTVNPMPTGRFVIPEISGSDIPDFNAFTAKFVGTPTFVPTHNAMCVRHDVASSWEDLVASGRDVTVGGSAPGGYLIGPTLVEYLGGPVKVITGYGGTSEIQAAVDRGELDATPACQRSLVQGLFPEWIEEDFLVPMFWWDVPIAQDWLDDLNAVMPPNIWDIVDATEEQKIAFAVAEAAEDYIRMFTLSEGTSDEILQAWRDAFKATVEDPEFAERAAVAGLEAGYGDPNDLVDLLGQAQSFGPEGLALIKTLYGLE